MNHERSLPESEHVSPVEILPVNTAQEDTVSPTPKQRRRRIPFANAALAALEAVTFVTAACATDTQPNPWQTTQTGIGVENKARKVREDEPKMANISLEDFYPFVPIAENRQPSSKPFLSETANKIAEEYGIHAGTFFDVPDNLVPRLTAVIDSKEVLPISYPEVLDWNTHFYEAAQYFNDPPSIAQILMTIESGGDPRATSPVPINDRGLYGVTPRNLQNADGTPRLDAYGKRFDPENDAQVRDPRNNALIAFKVLDETFSVAKNAKPTASRIEHYLAGIRGFNGGVAQAANSINSSEIAWESRLYDREARAMLAVGQIQYDLMQKHGLSRLQAIAYTYSPEVSARAAVLENAARLYLGDMKQGDFDAFRIFFAVAQQLSHREVTAQQVVVNHRVIPIKPVYDAALRDNRSRDHNWQPTHASRWQKNPALAIITAWNGGLVYNNGSLNFDRNAWFKVANMTVPQHIPKIVQRPETRASTPAPKVAAEPKVSVSTPQATADTLIGARPTLERAALDKNFYSQLDPRFVNNPRYPNWGDPGDNCGPTATANVLEALGEDANPALIKEQFVQDKYGYAFKDRNGRNQVIPIWDFTNSQTYVRIGYDNQGRPVGGIADYLRDKGYQVTVVTDRLVSNNTVFRSAPEHYREFDTRNPHTSRNIQRMVHLLNTGHKILAGGYPYVEGRQIPHIWVIDGIEKDASGKYFATVIDSFNKEKVKDEFARRRLVPLEDIGRDPILAIKKG